jgi:hypothetical protein
MLTYFPFPPLKIGLRSSSFTYISYLLVIFILHFCFKIPPRPTFYLISATLINPLLQIIVHVPVFIRAFSVVAAPSQFPMKGLLFFLG